MSDARLSEQYDTGKGCNGVVVLWHMNLDVTPIGDKGSDWMCGTCFQEGEDTYSVICFIVVYMPYLNMGMEYILPGSVERITLS